MPGLLEPCTFRCILAPILSTSHCYHTGVTQLLGCLEIPEQKSCCCVVCLHLPRAWLCRGSFILLADARACPLLPESWRVLPSPSLLAVAGQRGQSCTAACRRATR